MASSNIKKDEEHGQWETTQSIHNQHQWNDSSDDDKDNVDDHEFFDANDTDFHHQQSTSTESHTEADLLHKRLNAQLSTNEVPKKKTPG